MTAPQSTRTYLELRSPLDLRRGTAPRETPAIRRVDPCPVYLYRYLYTAVGRRHGWTDRLHWTDDAIQHHLARGDVHLWVAYWLGAPAGYFELQQHSDHSVEIAYLGLRPAFIGRGWGKVLVTHAVDEAWNLGADRIWLYTSIRDHPAALPNYLELGFTPVAAEAHSS